jgi:hypothetical protein
MVAVSDLLTGDYTQYRRENGDDNDGLVGL